MPLTAIPQHSVACCLSPELTAPRRAREQARKALFGWGLADHADIIDMIISELVTNAICHGAGPVSIRISYDNSHLRLEVHDDGPARPARRQVTQDAETGRGLAVIDGLIDLFGGSRWVQDDRDGDGKTVHVSVRLPDDQ